MQNNYNALKNFADPCKVRHFIGGKFGFRQVTKRHDLNYDNSVKITLFFPFQASLISTAGYNPTPLALRGHRTTTRIRATCVASGQKMAMLPFVTVHFSFQAGKNIRLCLPYFK